MNQTSPQQPRTIAHPSRTRPARTIVLATCLLITGGLVSVGALLGGCGSSAKSAGTTISSGITRDGVMTISVPPLPAESAGGTSRLVPDKAQYIKVEIFDTETGADGTPRLIPVALFDKDGKQLTSSDTPFLVINRRTAPNTAQQLSNLPIKNLIVRIGAYWQDPSANNPTNRDPAQNPALAQAELPFLPVRAQDLPSLSDDQREQRTHLKFTLSTQLTALEIVGPDTLDSAEKSTISNYRLVAHAGDAIVLQGADVLSNVAWKRTLLHASGKTVGASDDISSLADDVSSLTNASNKGVDLTGKGIYDSVIVLSVKDNESGLATTKEIHIVPQKGFVNVTLTEPPIGARSVTVEFSNEENSTAPLETVTKSWRDSTTLKDFTNSLSLMPGSTKVHWKVFNGEDGTGALLTEGTQSGVVVPRGDKTATPTLLTLLTSGTQGPFGTDEKSLVSIKVLSGNVLNATKNGLQPLSQPVAIDDPEQPLLAGQTYVIEVQRKDIAQKDIERQQDIPLRNAAFTMDFAMKDASALGFSYTLDPVADSETRFLLRLGSKSDDSLLDSGGKLQLRLTENAYGRQEKSVTPRIYADLGGSVKIPVN